MAKAKQAHHTAKELAAKAKAALQNAGGGKAGLADRKGGQAGHAKYKCHICGQQAPDLKTMQIHHDAKHPKLPWEPEKCTNMHDVVGVTTQGVAVRGSTKKK
ncbi:hypothetical protein CHLNCDRAFT_137279 [Chlorella variabilis]|uniref:C2H2-type domain-containing protein n=1 Tax=Chlorella variabilis TaxID=554065 RepID=E1ZM34_CHLVA|nr:hypothetical protein CHLNCDRAFT_137279 [Chlorella variabilis]EFN53042.1 hypothetical protein CHLNCDRAFT_137279 [Chlorella variabilis]|eukprot:XP_005845144.1 hypothetical protein CHLNCDRAFT_137279 [Chlorella variabilis]